MKGRNGSVHPVDKSSPVLPSSSYQRFLKENNSLPGVVITDFQEKQFKSRYVSSSPDVFSMSRQFIHG